MSEADLPAGPHARRLLVALCFGFSIFLDTKCPVVQEPSDRRVQGHSLWKACTWPRASCLLAPRFCPSPVLCRLHSSPAGVLCVSGGSHPSIALSTPCNGLPWPLLRNRNEIQTSDFGHRGPWWLWPASWPAVRQDRLTRSFAPEGFAADGFLWEQLTPGLSPSSLVSFRSLLRWHVERHLQIPPCPHHFRSSVLLMYFW